MKFDLWRVIPRPIVIFGKSYIDHDAVISVQFEPKWNKVNAVDARLAYQNYSISLRWPVMLQLQLHVALYRVGGVLAPHTDVIAVGERQLRIQFILRNAVRGGELLCERFIINLRNFKIFEPARYRHSVTEVLEGERLILNFGIRFSPRAIRPAPF